MKNSIRNKIMILVTIINILVFGSILIYLNCVAKPANEMNVSFLIRQNVETKSQEVSQWIDKRIVEYRTLAAIPAISSMDTRLITPIIDRVTNEYRYNDQTMETFSFIGKNGFCWINAEATENLIRYEEYNEIYDNDAEFIIGKPITNEDNRNVVLFYYAIKGYSGQKESLICSAVPVVRIQEIINTIQLYNSKSWIMDKDYNIITTDEDYIYDKYISKDSLSNIDIGNINMSTVLDVDGIKGDSKMFITPVQSYRDWYLVTMVEKDVINQSVDMVFKGFVSLMILIGILTLFLGKYITKSVLSPIKRLQTCMNQAQEGNLKCYYPTNSDKDEIYYLGTSFNTMIDELSNSMDKIVKQEEEKRKAQLQTLQEQIKPHFLYNTLDNIKWMAKKQGANEVSNAITALSTFFRLSLSHGDEIVTLKQEFKHTKSYLEIQKMRYHEKLSYTIFLDERIENYRITKIILQPIVENAINHGIKNSEKNGTINVSGTLQNNCIILSVEDDGVGMSSEKIAQIYKNMDDPNSVHYGMRNIIQRLRNTHPNFKFDITSTVNLGTTITIVIPLEEGDKNVL